MLADKERLKKDKKMDYKVKQIADLMQVSKPTVRKYINALPESLREQESFTENGTLHLTEKLVNVLIESMKAGEEEERKQAEKLMESLRKVKNQSGKISDSVENDSEFSGKSMETENSRKQTEKTIEILENQVAMLREQLDRKDEQITALNKSLSEVTAALTAAQTLHAAEMSSNLIEDQEAASKDPKKKGFFSRLFGK